MTRMIWAFFTWESLSRVALDYGLANNFHVPSWMAFNLSVAEPFFVDDTNRTIK